MPVLKIVLGDVVRMRKTHPCGNDQWEVVRLGADIGIRCLKCGRRVLMPRAKFERRIRRFIRRGPDAGDAVPEAPAPDSTA
ncbi:MAG: DUF951 domain-containing protein [Armatimonadota bacterium]|nr:DUF951 domain-containing protein [Armatimonadota bacterium]